MARVAAVEIRERIMRACRRCGRDPLSVTLVGVTKGRPVADIREAIASGINDVGENRVQEALAKFNELGRTCRWHMIGHLQTNKAKDAVSIFDLIHSLDSLKLARAIDNEAARAGKVQEVLVEVKTSPEESKSGVAVQDAPALLDEAAGLPHLRLIGVMTIAPVSSAPEKARVYFRQLKSIFDHFNARCKEPYRLKEISMGMSDDFEVAIEEGATMVRIGRALFGE